MVRNISSAKCQTVLFDPLVEPYQVLLLWNRVDMGVISMKVYSVFPKAPGLEHHYPIIYYHIQDNRARGLQSWIIRKRKLWQPRKSTRTWSWYLLTTSLSMQMWKNERQNSTEDDSRSGYPKFLTTDEQVDTIHRMIDFLQSSKLAFILVRSTLF